MKPTSIPRVSLTKSVLIRFSSVIHPPLPLTPIESRKFLTLIKDSFRTQLSAATPPVTPTEQHFSEIISAAQSSDIPAIDGLTKEARIQKFLEDPLGVYTEQSLLGKASIELAAVCLMKHAKLQQATGTPPPKTPEGESAAAVVLGELRRAKFGPPAEVLRNEDLLRAVTYALIIEGRTSVILRWARGTREETTLPIRRSIIKQAVYYMKIEYGWMHALGFFRQVINGSRENEGRFSQRDHCSTGLKLCETGLKEGFGGTPEYTRLIRSSVHWTLNWQQQAMVHLVYGKMTGVGVKYFYDLCQNDGAFWEWQKSLWYHQNSRLAMELVLECLAQGQVEEAEMITELVKKRFAGKVPGLDVGLKNNVDKAGAENIADDGNHGSDLQGILNALG